MAEMVHLFAFMLVHASTQPGLRPLEVLGVAIISGQLVDHLYEQQPAILTKETTPTGLVLG